MWSNRKLDKLVQLVSHSETGLLSFQTFCLHFGLLNLINVLWVGTDDWLPSVLLSTQNLDRIRKSEVGEDRDRGLEWTLDTHLLTTDNEEAVLLTLSVNFLMQFINVLLTTGVVCYPTFTFAGEEGGMDVPQLTEDEMAEIKKDVSMIVLTTSWL